MDYSKISAKIGHHHWLDCVTHDDGQFAEQGGGKTVLHLAMPGTGKSTLMCHEAQMSKYVQGSKKNFVRSMELGENLSDFDVFLETVIWRVRDGDSCPNIITQNWINSYKGAMGTAKDFHLWVHVADKNVVFYSYNHKRQIIPINNMPKIEFYRDAEDLMRRLHWGAINAVLEPQTYTLSPMLIQKLREKKMDIREEVEIERERESSEPKRGRPPKGAKKKERAPGRPSARHGKKSKDYAAMEISPSYFWFDLIHVAKSMNRYRHIHFCIDEVDDIFEARSEGDVWKLIDILASDWKDLRKYNISTALSTHQTDYVDWRILKRVDYIIWMRGATINPNYSMLWQQAIVSNLPIGMFLIEHRKIDFGRDYFTKIPRGQPAMRIDGLKGESFKLDAETALHIMEYYGEEPKGIEA